MALKSVNPKVRWVRRIGIWAAGWTMNEAVVWTLDFVIYPLCIASYGPVWGWMWALLASIVLDLVAVWFYDQAKVDWFGLEALRAVTAPVAKTRRQRFVRTLL